MQDDSFSGFLFDIVNLFVFEFCDFVGVENKYLERTSVAVDDFVESIIKILILSIYFYFDLLLVCYLRLVHLVLAVASRLYLLATNVFLRVSNRVGSASGFILVVCGVLVVLGLVFPQGVFISGGFALK